MILAVMYYERDDVDCLYREVHVLRAEGEELVLDSYWLEPYPVGLLWHHVRSVLRWVKVVPARSGEVLLIPGVKLDPMAPFALPYFAVALPRAGEDVTRTEYRTERSTCVWWSSGRLAAVVCSATALCEEKSIDARTFAKMLRGSGGRDVRGAVGRS